jgi:hypothetical protein
MGQGQSGREGMTARFRQSGMSRPNDISEERVHEPWLIGPRHFAFKLEGFDYHNRLFCQATCSLSASSRQVLLNREDGAAVRRAHYRLEKQIDWSANKVWSPW